MGPPGSTPDGGGADASIDRTENHDMTDITAFMIVKNEAVLLPRCLASLRGVVDELAILDTGSTDNTVAVIEHEATAGHFRRVRWLPHEFRDFGSARTANLAMVDTEWALWLDADEVLSDELRDRLGGMGGDGSLGEHAGWRLRRANRVLGRVMRSRRLAADYVLRLFRTDGGQLSNSLVHEGIELAAGATVGQLEEPLYHDTLMSIGPYLQKVDHYTTLDVANPTDKKFNPLHFVVTGPLTFFKDYVTRGGLVDGWPGFVWCSISAWTCVQRDWKRMKRDWMG